MADDDQSPEALIPQFVFERLLNQDSQGRRITLLGSIATKPALLLIERAAFSTSITHLTTFVQSLTRVQNLGNNDIYKWYLASQSSTPTTTGTSTHEPPSTLPHDLKLNLIYPCTPKHISKYTPQKLRYVLETPDIYASYIRPWIVSQREQGRLQWVFNILSGLTEQEDIVYRSPCWAELDDATDRDGFLLLPDLNWDRKTVSALHLLCLVRRRDRWSVRDLCKGDVPWLRGMVERLTDAVVGMYGPGTERGGEEGLERDAVKMYLHYQPTYHHLHIHIVALTLDAAATQATGKALDLQNVIATLAALPSGDTASYADLDLAYTIGENHELWEQVWGPLKKGKLPAQ